MEQYCYRGGRVSVKSISFQEGLPSIIAGAADRMANVRQRIVSGQREESLCSLSKGMCPEPIR